MSSRLYTVTRPIHQRTDAPTTPSIHVPSIPQSAPRPHHGVRGPSDHRDDFPARRRRGLFVGMAKTAQPTPRQPALHHQPLRQTTHRQRPRHLWFPHLPIPHHLPVSGLPNPGLPTHPTHQPPQLASLPPPVMDRQQTIPSNQPPATNHQQPTTSNRTKTTRAPLTPLRGERAAGGKGPKTDSARQTIQPTQQPPDDRPRFPVTRLNTHQPETSPAETSPAYRTASYSGKVAFRIASTADFSSPDK